MKSDKGFFLINFHPKGEPEAFICCVTCPPYKTLAGGLRARNSINYGFALKALHMKASDSYKVQNL
jgi:hypothetical protein